VQIGDVVKITQGPLAGLLGQLKVSGQRVLIVIELQGRLLDVEIDVDWIVAAAPEPNVVPGIRKQEIHRQASA
jgi:hypothetical protein